MGCLGTKQILPEGLPHSSATKLQRRYLQLLLDRLLSGERGNRDDFVGDNGCRFWIALSKRPDSLCQNRRRNADYCDQGSAPGYCIFFGVLCSGSFGLGRIHISVWVVIKDFDRSGDGALVRQDAGSAV